MKKIISTICFIMLLLGINGCSDDKFGELYDDPSKTPVVSVEKLMTGVFELGNLYTMPWYWRYFTYETSQMGRYAQTLGWINDPGMYESNENYNNDRWTQFYKMLIQMRLQEDTYDKLQEAVKPDYEVFMVLTRIFMYDHLQQLVDAFGDAPYKEAGYLGITQNIQTSKPAFDAAEDLYKMMLDDLKKFNTYLAETDQSSLTTKMLASKDYINNGNLAKWRTYCNSLRLRMALRVADHGPLAAEGQAIVKEILSNPGTYPVVENNSQNILINYQGNKLTAMTGQHEDGIKGGFESNAGRRNRASKKMIEVLQGDPRLEILFDKTQDGLYMGIDPMMERSAQEALFTRSKDDGGNYFSSVDSATFSRNDYFPGIIITASEIDFIRAEAILKNWITGDAGEAFQAGVTKSIEFYYYLNGLSKYRTPVTPPTTQEIADFAEAKWNAFGSNDKLAAVGEQKWLHFGNIQMFQTWCEVRRTDYPKLTFQDDMGSVECPKPPYRLKYTFNEKVYNDDNYKKVQAKDTPYEKIFWMK